MRTPTAAVASPLPEGCRRWCREGLAGNQCLGLSARWLVVVATARQHTVHETHAAGGHVAVADVSNTSAHKQAVKRWPGQKWGAIRARARFDGDSTVVGLSRIRFGTSMYSIIKLAGRIWPEWPGFLADNS